MRHRTDLAALIGAAAAVGLFVLLGGAAGSSDAFGLMGFDLDRAELLAASLGAVLAGATAGLISARRVPAVIAATASLWALFGPTYAAETVRAASYPVLGPFNPVGWVETGAVLTGTGILVGLAVGILGAHVRSGAIEIAHGFRRARSKPQDRVVPRASLAIGMLMLAMAVVGVPVLGQIVNVGPDSLMVSGGGIGTPIAGGSGSNQPAASLDAGGSSTATSVPLSGQGGVHPWTAWRPSGSGSVVDETLPAPWRGGKSPVVHFSVYLPPQYQSGTRRYPAEYELPNAFALFESATSIRPTLDRLIDDGKIPASVFVFVSSAGGPFVDSECIDAPGGSEWFDTFIGSTLVPFVDATFRTIASASARTLLGFSQGGFCAANVLLHHPSVFHESVSFSGYYSAAPMLGVAASAVAVYGGDQQAEVANSPMLLAGDVPSALRSKIMFTLVGDPTAGLLGGQLTQFASLDTRLGYAVTVLDTPLGHSWFAVRALLPSALVAVATHEAADGAFDGVPRPFSPPAGP